MADPRSRGDDGTKILADIIADARKRLRELEASTGTQTADLVARVNAALENLDAQVQAAITANSYTRAQIDASLAGKANTVHTHSASDITSGGTTGAGFTVGGALNVNGAVGVTGAMTATGDATAARGIFPTGVRSTGARNNQLTTGYVAAYIDSTGNLGFAPSTRASKDIGDPYAVDMAKFLAQTLFKWQYKNGGMNGIGPIADDMHAAGLTEFVTYSEDGVVQGLRYESLIIGLWSAYVQSRTATLAEFAKRMVQTVTQSSMTALGINAEKTYAIVWPKEFADINYAVSASVTSSGLALAAVCAVVPGSKTTKGCSVTVRSIGLAIAANSTLTVEAIHV